MSGEVAGPDGTAYIVDLAVVLPTTRVVAAPLVSRDSGHRGHNDGDMMRENIGPEGRA